MSSLKLLLGCFFFLSPFSLLHAQDVTGLMQNREYKEVLDHFKGELNDDSLLLLKARAEFLSGQFEASIITTEKLTSEHPESVWINKAKFLQAQAHSQLRRYENASEIYEREAEKLFSPSTKDEGARLLIEVADKFTNVPENADLELAIKTDFKKAITLLNQALNLECSIEMKEAIHAKVISLLIQSSNWKDAIREALVYLEEYDPNWKGSLNSMRRISLTEQDKNETKWNGKNRGMVRFQLCEAYHRSEDRDTATYYLTEFIEELKQAKDDDLTPLLADATWLRLMAMRQAGGKPRNLQEWTADAKTYLQAYPNHIHAGETAYSLGNNFLSYDEKENAINAYKEYIEKNQAFIEKPMTARPETKKELLARQTRGDDRYEQAHYEIGNIYLQLNEFEKAREAWKQYSQKFPNGEKWAACQKGLVDIDFNIAIHAVSLIQGSTEKDAARNTAQKALDDFISKHPLDQRISITLSMKGNIHYQKANEFIQQLKKTPDEEVKKQQLDSYRAALAQWDILITKYPRSSQAIEAQYRSASIYEKHLGDIEKALEIYDQSSHESSNPQIKLLKSFQLSASSSTAFTTSDAPYILLKSRNIEKVTVKQYWLDIESYFLKGRLLDDINSLDIDLIEADKTWEVTLPSYKKYYSLDSKIDIPFPANKPGICVVKVESETFSSTTFVVRSNIDIAVRSNKEEVIAYVHLAGNDNRPAKDTEIIIADGGKVFTTGKTDEQGVFHYRNAALSEINDLRVLAHSADGAATTWSENMQLKPMNEAKPRVWYNLAKKNYLPGETIEITGVIRFPAKDRSKLIYESPSSEQRSYTLTIRQSTTKKLIYKSKITTSPTGVFLHPYKLPESINFASLEIELSADFDKSLPPFKHNISIDKNAEMLVTLKLELDKKWTAEDPIIQGKISGKYRWGAAYSNKKVVVSLPNEKKLELKTDERGEATFRYDSRYIQSGEVIDFSAESLEQSYESNAAFVFIDPLDFSILASTDLASAPAGADVTLTAKTVLPDETPVSREIKLEVIQDIKVMRDPILYTCNKGANLTSESSRELIIQTVALKTDAKTGKIKHVLKFDKSGKYRLRITSIDSKGRQVIAKSAITIHDESGEEKLVLFTDKRGLEVGKSATIHAYSYLKSPANALMIIETDRIIEKRMITLQPGKNEIPLALSAAHAPSVLAYFMVIHERAFYSASEYIPVLNKLTLKVTTTKVEPSDSAKKFDYKAKIQAFNADGNAVSADFFVHLTHRLNEEAIIDDEEQVQTFYNTRSSCGIEHQGEQDMILTEIRDEIERMEQAQEVSSERGLLPGVLSDEQTTNQVAQRELEPASLENGGGFSVGISLNRSAIKSYMFNPDGEYNDNGVNFTGNQKRLSEYEYERSRPALVGGGFSDVGNIFPVTPATPTSFLNEETVNTNVFSKTLSIPVEGAEIPLTREMIYGELRLYVMGIDPSCAIGIHHEDLDANLKDLVATPSKDLVGTPVMNNASIQTKKGMNKFTLTLPNDLQATQLKLTSSHSHQEFFDHLIHAPLVSRFSSDTSFNQSHPAGQLMVVCSYLDYLKTHKQDVAAQEKLKISASRICADLTFNQNEDGSWSQIQNRNASSIIYTTLAYQSLMMAKNRGVEFENKTISSALKWINNQQKSLPTNLYNSRAIVQLALASSGDADFATCNRLYRERAKMDNVGKAILANVFVVLEKYDFTKSILQEITEDTKITIPSESLFQSAILLDAFRLNAQLATKEIPTVKFTHHFCNDLDKAYAAYSYSIYLQGIKLVEASAELKISVNGTELKDSIVPVNLLKQGNHEIQIESNQDGAIVSAELIGRENLTNIAKVADFTVSDRNYYKEKFHYHGQELESAGTSPVVKSEVGATVRVHLKGKIKNALYPDSILIEEIPAGYSYLDGSLEGNHSGARLEGNHLVITYGSLPDTFQLTYTLVAEHPGSWTHNPSVLCPSNDTKIIVCNSPVKLTVLDKGQKDETPYQLNANELYELARLNFRAKQYQAAKQQIIEYRKLKKTNEDPGLAQMLLWIETEQAEPDSQLLADSFEILTERNPDLVIPFHKILKVGKAYRKLSEFERSMDVYTATLEAGFSTDSYVGAALEDQGKFMSSVDFQNALWLRYPDLDEISGSQFALSQQIYSKSAKASELGKNPATQKLYSEKELIELSLLQTRKFLTHAPEHELSDDASFSIANALFALKSYDTVAKHAAKASEIHKDSKHATSFRYMQALGHFWLRNYDQALKSASDVAQGNSDDKDLAAYITAQIYHAKGMPEKAIECYKGIKKSYPDAKESIAYFEQKSISIDEVNTLNSGDKFSFNLKYRNIKEAQFQVYRVDLMQLYLRQKNLSNIAEVNLAGITPKFNLTKTLGTGQDFQEREQTIELPVKEDGAYLVICRGDYLHTTGLILITPLKIEVQEYPKDRELRVNVSDKKSGDYIDSVHVKAIGINESDFKSVMTDLRGVWKTDDITSPSTIIAKDPKGRYAFFRSKLDYEKANANSQTDPFGSEDPQASPAKVDFNENLKNKQDTIFMENVWKHEKNLRSKGKGVEIKKARKK